MACVSASIPELPLGEDLRLVADPRYILPVSLGDAIGKVY